ncbi:claudin-4-like [Polypterus senegalus]
MGAAGVQIVAVALTIVGLVAAIICCALPRWKESSFSGDNIVTAQVTQEGLWMSCVVQSTGQMQCKMYDSMLVLARDLQAARAMVIISCVLSILGLLVTFAGSDFTTCVEEGPAKGKIVLVSGIMIIVSGLMLMVPVSWSANTVISAFYDPNNPRKMELGPCIFLGWAASVLFIIAGGLLCFFRPRESNSNYSAKYYSGQQPASAPTKNYV